MSDGANRPCGWPGARRATEPTSPRRWTIDLPCSELLDSNTLGGTWGKRHRIGAQIHRSAGWLARAQRIPTLDRAQVIGEILPTSRHRRDPHNWQPTLKAAVDGLVAVGVIPDDNPEHLVLTLFRVGPQIRCARRGGRGHIHFRLILTEAEAP